MITLVLGGARSGKSAVAERIAAATGAPVTYVATASVADADMAERVASHQARRPPSWTTVEAGADLAGAIGAATGTVLVDALGPWLAGFSPCGPPFDAPFDAVCAALGARSGDVVVVSEEVGLGVHPSSAAGRRFRDALGLLNQRVAALADEVLLVVAGRALRLRAVDDVLAAATVGAPDVNRVAAGTAGAPAGTATSAGDA